MLLFRINIMLNYAQMGVCRWFHKLNSYLNNIFSKKDLNADVFMACRQQIASCKWVVLCIISNVRSFCILQIVKLKLKPKKPKPKTFTFYTIMETIEILRGRLRWSGIGKNLVKLWRACLWEKGAPWYPILSWRTLMDNWGIPLVRELLLKGQCIWYHLTNSLLPQPLLFFVN